jgi:hypothetical protein|tara:strand:- start:1258 stop:1416 length:159 start_codon:yes stop_codon:yes gene_type:complete
MFSVTKLSGYGFILSGIGGILTGKIPIDQGVTMILTGVAIIGGRNAINKIRP